MNNKIEEMRNKLDYYVNEFLIISNEFSKEVDGMKKTLYEYENKDDYSSSREVSLQVGDYLSFFNSDSLDCTLTKLIECDDGYYILVDEETNAQYLYSFDTLEEINDLIDDSITPYYIKNTTEIKEGNGYMISDINHQNYEISIVKNGENFYNIVASDREELFYEQDFKTLDEITLRLHKDYKLIKQLRHSTWTEIG